MKNNDRIRNELNRMIMDHSTILAIDSVGGSDNFKRIMGIKTPNDFLNLFNGIPYETNYNVEVGGEPKDNIFFRYDDSPIKMIYSISETRLFVSDMGFPIDKLFPQQYTFLDHNCELLIKDWFITQFHLPARFVWFSILA